MKTVSILTTDSIEKISDDTTMADVTSAVVVPTEKKKLKKDTSHYENPEAFTDGHKQSDQLNDEADLVSAKIRKKRKRKASCLVDDTECDQGALEDTKPEGETTDRDPNGNVSKDIDSASKGSDLKKKKKRTSNEQNNNSGQDEALNEGSQSKENKKKSKKKKNTGVLDRDQQKTTEDDQVNEEEADIPKKKKKRKGETNGISSKPARLKKSKHETEATCEREESMKDVVLVSVKEGNSFEINIDQARRKSLQEEVDRESGNIKGTKFGQWDTASFQSSAQQAKFFRLMGGFKKGNQAALASSPSHEKANMALGKTEEKVLERNLESEFEKALSWKKNRGIGLGFQPAQKKASYIDKHVTKSIKFED
ncbi:lysine-rich nucleolar protein 1 isoform 1-T1 [Rhinophrynus dorsalis]